MQHRTMQKVSHSGRSARPLGAAVRYRVDWLWIVGHGRTGPDRCSRDSRCSSELGRVCRCIESTGRYRQGAQMRSWGGSCRCVRRCRMGHCHSVDCAGLLLRWRRRHRGSFFRRQAWRCCRGDTSFIYGSLQCGVRRPCRRRLRLGRLASSHCRLKSGWVVIRRRAVRQTESVWYSL